MLTYDGVTNIVTGNTITSNEVIKFWGKGFQDDEYEILQKKYEEYRRPVDFFKNLFDRCSKFISNKVSKSGKRRSVHSIKEIKETDVVPAEFFNVFPGGLRF